LISSSFIDKLKNAIDKHRIVSFDIFDTLLLRPYAKPADLFLHLEYLENAQGFCESRIYAENVARKKQKDREDIFIDNIYEEIEPKFRPLKEKELRLEREVLQTNPETALAFEYAKEKGKRIIIASDMYLPLKFMEEVLADKGYSGYEKCYMSSEFKKSKSTGNLFKHILNDLEVSPKEMLHIGDNVLSDCSIPKKLGINVFPYIKVTEQFLKADRRAAEFCRSNSGLGASILISLLAMHWRKTELGLEKVDYWESLGYRYAGPAAYAFSRFIERTAEANRLDTLFFVARDGWTLQKVFNTFDKSIRTEYIYAPRLLNSLRRLDFKIKDNDRAQSAIDYYRDKSERLKKLAEETDFSEITPYNFVHKHWNKFKSLAEQDSVSYKKYLSGKVTEAGRVGVVDTATISFSAQKLIQEAADRSVYGIYWTVKNSSAACAFVYDFFQRSYFEDRKDHIIRNWNFIEFLLTSPEPPLLTVSPDGKPLCVSEPSPFEKTRGKLYPRISEYALRFAEEIKSIFGGKDIYLTYLEITEWINIFSDYPSKTDICNMESIWYSVNHAHNKYEPLFSARASVNDLLLHPKRSKKILKKCFWRTLPQTLFMCAMSPVLVKFKLRKIDIILFPRLKKRCFTVKLYISEQCNYSFSIGGPYEKQ
jgi:HAD superfamily hydrolase (TIGR01549 family)